MNKKHQRKQCRVGAEKGKGVSKACADALSATQQLNSKNTKLKIRKG